ncbi:MULTISPECIES: hypothetical protein [unclassified Paenibacillus]|uniref:hypothetical protein n=1 Tax=unclassified Paenibacillus TaxID=185978 RepID=UPI0006F1F4C6|nr:hypothetical protein [Paenibacillus sp. Soil750]KRE74617.1 hypothetical protein ASL11_04420 [Paenibacillus sp. Soil750]
MITKRKVHKLTISRKIRKKRVGSPRKVGLKKRNLIRKKGRAIRRLRPLARRKGNRRLVRRLIRFPRRKGSRIIARRRKVPRRIIQSPRARRAQLAYDRAFNEAYNASYGVGFAEGYTWELTNPTIA